MSILENKKVEGVHYSRFIASYVNSGGELYYDEFKAWLEHLNILSEQDISNIIEMANCGKLELEMDAKLFLKATKNQTKS